jgi:hypothetical protein
LKRAGSETGMDIQANYARKIVRRSMEKGQRTKPSPNQWKTEKVVLIKGTLLYRKGREMK